MIKAVFFDIDNTVYNYDASHKHAMWELYEYCKQNLDLTPEQFDNAIENAKKLVDMRLGAVCAATHNRLIRFQTMLEMLKKPLFPFAYDMEKCYWNSLINFAKPQEGIENLMQNLKKQGYFVGVGTNMTADWQFVKLNKFGLGKYIDALVTSEEVSVEKPDKKLFEVCAEKAQAKPSECVFIGDSIKHDIEGAENAGMKTILYTGCLEGKKLEKANKSSYTVIHHFDECLDVINKFENN